MPNTALKRGLTALAFSIALACNAQGQPNPSPQSHAESNSRMVQTAPTTPSAASAPISQSQSRNANAPEDKKPDNASGTNWDLWAQWTMAVAALIQLAVSTAALVGLYYTVKYAKRAWEESERGANASVQAAFAAETANNDAREFFAAERRPWIKITPSKAEDGTFDVSIDRATNVATIGFDLKNVGLSPAIQVCVNVLEAVASPRVPDFHELQRRIVQAKSDPLGVGPTIFPDDTPHSNVIVELAVLNQDSLRSPIYLEGFIEYRWQPDGPLYITPFVWTMRFAIDVDTGQPAAIRVQPFFFSLPPT